MEKLKIQLFGEDDTNNTAQTNDGDDVAGQTNDDNNDTTTGEEKTPEELAAEKEASEAKEKAEQEKQDAYNKEQARLRRERERQAEIETTRINAIKEAVGTNPYTDKTIETKEDVEEYLLMKQIDKDGGDPKADYSDYLKKQNREKFEQQEKAAKDRARMTQEINDFVKAHPEVNLEELLGNDDFKVFAKGKTGQNLESLYTDYQKVFGKYQTQTEEERRKAREEANRKANPGSQTGNPTGSDQYYTVDQLKSMTTAEWKANEKKATESARFHKMIK